eukprot:TRINITY_DN15648_c0_g1_i1.p2 TRINITY_DN15648_c0_g1~~TRINITY_DN15648_c0_g1_i1.p2  ORF type:complete len:149 (+),score=39.25 TRINITY_DN15648_c0_g1_i1:1078-1524(+)
MITAKKSAITSKRFRKYSPEKEPMDDYVSKNSIAQNVETSLRSLKELNKASFNRTIDVPYYLKKVEDKPKCKIPSRAKIEVSMKSALRRYEDSLKRVKEVEDESLTKCVKGVEEWGRINDIKAQKKRLNVMSVQEFLLQQMNENVVLQ